MAFDNSNSLGKRESKMLRALKALPFLGITAAAGYFMLGMTLPTMRVRIVEMIEDGVENNIGQKGFVKPLHNFYGIEFVDSKLRGLTACFVSFQFVDLVGYWQLFSFLIDAGILYAILLIESARRANSMTLASVPVLLGESMQFLGIGVVLPICFFVHYIQSPIENFRARDMRLTDMGYTASILPVLIIAHYIPSFGSCLLFIEPQTRHAWNWIWQLFPIWTSILQFVLKKTVMSDTVEKDRIENPNRDMSTIQYTIGSLCALAAAMWWYVLYSAPYSWYTLFVPNIKPGQTGAEYIRMFLQYDEVSVMGASLLWILYLYSDLKKAGIMSDSWLSILLKGVVSLVAFGRG